MLATIVLNVFIDFPVLFFNKEEKCFWLFCPKSGSKKNTHDFFWGGWRKKFRVGGFLGRVGKPEGQLFLIGLTGDDTK